MSRRIDSLVHFPGETLEAILGFIDSSSDILSLSLTCRSLHDLAIPDHLHYRVIQVPTVGETWLWERLVARPVLAKNVRVFRWNVPKQERRVPSSGPALVPDRYQQLDDFEKCAIKLQRALSIMTNLQAFEWDFFTVISKVDSKFQISDRFPHGDWVFGALRNTNRLQRLRVELDEHRLHFSSTTSRITSTQGDYYLGDSMLFDLGSSILTSVDLIFEVTNEEVHIYMTRVRKFIASCPALRELGLSLTESSRHEQDVDLSDILLHTTWPCLEQLKMHYFEVRTLHIQAFTERHPKLRVLNLHKAYLIDPSLIHKPWTMLSLAVLRIPRNVEGIERLLASIVAPRLQELSEIRQIDLLFRQDAYRELVNRFRPSLQRLALDHYVRPETHTWASSTFPDLHLFVYHEKRF